MTTFLASKRAAIAWSFYDWASSSFSVIITTFIFAPYFTEKIAKNHFVGTHQWGDATSIAAIIIAICSPIFGSIADHEGRRKPWLAFFSLLTIITAALLWFAKPSEAYVLWTLSCFIIGTIGFELASVFYNTMMHGLVPDNYLGRLSGWAWGLGYVGGLICLVIALFFLKVPVAWLDQTALEQVRICGPLVAIWFAVFALPLFIFTPDHASTGIGIRQSIKQGLHELVETFHHARKHKQVLKFLVAHMIYIDGLNTIFAFGGIYAAGTFGFNTDQIIEFGIGMEVTAGIGAALLGWLDDYLGSKSIILASLSMMILSGIVVLCTHHVVIFVVAALFLSSFVGPVQAASRSLMIRISPPEQLTEMFGLYALSGKATAFIGPWLVGLFTLLFTSQRIGMAPVMGLLFIGMVLLLTVRPQTS